jgi:hypothetical protein
VNYTTKTIATLDANLGPFRRRRHRRPCWARRREGQRLMRPVAVVMVHKDVEDALKMVVVQDQEPVETL